MDVEELIERARKAAIASSAVQREMAEAKSLRQGDNPERRTDLYSWPTPEQTLEGQLAEALSRQKAAGDAIRDIAERLIDQRDEPWPGGTESDRLHYWRDKAISASRDIRATLNGIGADRED